MTMSEYPEYVKLKDEVLRSVGNIEQYNELLSILKEFFREDINSPRRFEQITSIRHLLRVLEVRDVLSEHNVAPLKEIARRLPNSRDLLRRIEEYESSVIPTQFVNLYASEKSPSLPNQIREPVETTYINNNPNAMSTRKKQRIVDTIVADIGITWRNLARSLDIKEGVIDKLDDTYKEVTEKARQVMELYNKQADDNTWFFDLCDALETCRRGQLLKKIKKIVVMNI